MADQDGAGTRAAAGKGRSNTRGPRTSKPRRPPYSEEAERGVLGSALQDAQRVLDLCVQHKLTPESFFVPAHQVLFEAMLDMNQQAKALDLVTLGDYLDRMGQTAFVGGPDYLEQLEDATPTPAHAEHYIEIVHEKYLLRNMIDRARTVIDDCYEESDSPAELLQRAEQSFFEIAEFKKTDLMQWTDMVNKFMGDVERIYQTKRGLTGIPTGFRDVDDMLLGLQPGDMVILAARPSMGKTSLAMNIVEHIATAYRSCSGPHDQNARPVAVFSLEMSADQLVRRMICCNAGVSSHSLAKGILPRRSHGDLTQAADALIKAPIYVDDGAGLTALEVKSRARRMKSRYDIQLIVVDYLQLMNYPAFARDGRQREIAAISGAMKAMAKELHVPVIVLSQLSRAPESRHGSKPKLSDLRDSGAIEQDADVVMLLRRPSRSQDDSDQDPDDPGLTILDIAKHRNGPVGEVRLNFEEQYTRFRDRSDRSAPDEAAFPIPEGINA